MIGARVAAWVLALAAIGCALTLARIAALPGARGMELGRAHVTSLDPELAARVAQGDIDVLVQWFGPSTSERPAGYDEVEARVRAAFDALEKAAPQRVHTQILRPDEDPEARAHAESLGLAPFRARRIVRDGWTDVPVWSALRTTVAGRGASVVRALTPDLADGTQALIAAGIAEIESPRRPRIALSAPSGHARLRALLRELGDVTEVDYDIDASLPDELDLFCWIAPTRVDARHVDRLRAFVERGGSAIIAAERFRARVEGAELVLDAVDDASDKLFADLGVLVDARPLLEAPPPEAAGSAADWTYHVVRSIGSSQDFRAFQGQPNGTLAFQVPAALSPDIGRLRANRATFTSIATSSDRCFVMPVGTTHASIGQLASGEFGTAVPPQALIALLRPDDPTRGSVVVSATASPFGDRGLADPNFVHEELVRVIVGTLASAERRMLASVARARPAPIADVSNTERWMARALCVALVPLLLVVIGLARGALSLRELGGRTLRFAFFALVATACVGVLSLAIGTRAGVDASRAAEHGLASELTAIAAEAGSAPTSITFAFSSGSDLPAELRPLARELEGRCERLARAAAGFTFRRVEPESAENTEIRRWERTSEAADERTTRSFFASVVIERGTARRVLDFADPAAFEHGDFRLALALRDVTSGARTALAFASEPARVTPAEAQSLYQKHKLFAPGTGDPFAAARALLASNGFDVRAVDPTQIDTSVLAGAVFVWLQPRRDATAGVRVLAQHLERGGTALVAAQMHRVRPRLRSDRAGDASLWPEPMFPDIDRLWLPAIGVQLAPELVLDAESGVVRTVGTRERDGRAESVTMDLASPLVVRSTPAARPTSPLTAGVGDLVMPSPSRIALDTVKLANAGLVARPILATSPRAWTVPWNGGDVPEAAYVAPKPDAEPLVLGVLVEGRFPGISVDPALGSVSDSQGESSRAPDANAHGRLVVFGASEPFTDAQLAVGDGARLLLQSCAALALPPEYGAILARRPTVGGYRVLEPDARLRARVVTLAAGPLLVLLLAGLWRAWRARRIARSVMTASPLERGAA